MEYVLGSAITLVAIVIILRVLKPAIQETNKYVIRYSQSHIYSLMAPLLDYAPIEKSKIETQASKHLNSSYIKVVIVNQSAYWIKDNALYTADLVEGAVDKETTRRVDTMTMDKIELEKTLLIVEKLREGLDNDNSGTGK
jgi:hypothetical protein